MSIGNRIALGFGLSLVVLLVLAGVAFQGANQLTESTQGLLTTHGNVRAISDVRSSAGNGEKAALRVRMAPPSKSASTPSTPSMLVPDIMPM